jgi:hypothetical protein
MSNNLRLWDLVKDPDTTFSDKATKEFSGKGGFKGTATDPMTLYGMATKLWGPIGLVYGKDSAEFNSSTGCGHVPIYPCWGFETVSDEVIAHEHVMTVRFWYPDTDMGVMKCAEGTGCTPVQESIKGTMCNTNDFAKKSRTDAQTNAMSRVGFAASVYLGKYNDSKYAEEVRMRQATEAESSAPDIVAVQQAFAQVAADLAAGGDPDECMAAFVAVGSGPFKALSKAKQGHVSGAAKALKQAIAEAKARATGMDAALGAE